MLMTVEEAIAVGLAEQQEYHEIEYKGRYPMKILLSQIDPPAWNSRLPKAGKDEEKKIASLGESLKVEGQINPIEVEKRGGVNGDTRYELVNGSRRLAAARLIGWTEMEGNVFEDRSEAEIVLRNIIDNEQREQLTSFEQAQACLKLRDLGLTQEDVGNKLGYSRQKVTNLVRSYVALSNVEPLLNAWRNGDEALTTTFLNELASKDRYPTTEKKIEAFSARKEELAALGGKRADAGTKRGDKSKGGKGASAGYPLVQKHARVVFDFVKSKKCPAKIGEARVDKEWVISLINYLVGQRKTPPNGIEVAQPKPDSDE